MVGTATSPFWDNNYSLLTNKAASEKGISRMLRRRGMKALRELLVELNGVAAGQAALAQTAQVTAVQHVNDVGPGGVRTVALTDDVDRVTTAADVTRIAAILTDPTAPGTYPDDKSGNGSGGNPYA